MSAPASFKSRPVYAPLVPRAGSLHVCVADAAGEPALLALAGSAPAGFWERAWVLLVGAPGSGGPRALAQLGAASFGTSPSLAAALPRLRQVFATARMGTRLYVAGHEGLIGAVSALALEAGLDPGAIEAEHRGSLVRRVQCVHCKGITGEVTTQPVRCSHCGLTLLVRDHFSRRIGAFQGVCIDAEVPGSAPPCEESFA